MRSFLRSIFNQASSLGATCIELTGGGEPLEHPQAARFLDIAASFKSKVPSLRIGVLSNANLRPGKKSEELLNALMALDYIRLGWTEHYDREREKYMPTFFSTIQAIGERRAKVDSSLRIGVKLLLNSTNSQNLITMI